MNTATATQLKPIPAATEQGTCEFCSFYSFGYCTLRGENRNASQSICNDVAHGLELTAEDANKIVVIDGIAA